MKTSELTGAALDWAVCMAKGCTYTIDIWLYEYKHLEGPRYSTDWSRGGPIIEREKINTGWDDAGQPIAWLGYVSEYDVVAMYYGLTPLIAAMRCYVASKIGDDVEVPDELH